MEQKWQAVKRRRRGAGALEGVGQPNSARLPGFLSHRIGEFPGIHDVASAGCVLTQGA
jgi:hypothetical protein